MVIAEFFKRIEKLDPDARDAMIFLLNEIQTTASVRNELNDLRMIIRDTIRIQNETGQEFKALAVAQKELAESQKELKVELKELAESQKELKVELKELAESQKELKVELKELAESQKELKVELKELAQAQRNTEEELKTLTITVKDLQKQVGGIAMDVGYGIEDKIIPYMYDFGSKEFGVDVSTVARKNIVYPDGNYDEVNIYAEGVRNGKPAFIIGECKAHPGKKDVDKFSKMTERLKKVLKGDLYLFAAGYTFTPDVEAYIRKKYPHIRLFQTYQFDLDYIIKSKNRHSR